MENTCKTKMGALIFTEGNTIQTVLKACSEIKKSEKNEGNKYIIKLEKIASMFIIKDVAECNISPKTDP
jgi:hypothetical protein